MNLKYLPDGRKVAVLGEINKTEFIVQEIFVTGQGVEIAGGEKFTAKGLLDSPSITWKQKDAAEAETRYKQATAKLESIELQVHEAKKLLTANQSLAHQAKKFLCGIPVGALNDVIDLCAGKIEWIIVEGYGIQRPVKYIDALINRGTEYDRDASLKMLSLFGDTGRRPELAIPEYTDGSGNNRRKCTMHRTRASALAKLKELAAARINHEKYVNITVDEYLMCLEEGVVFNKAIHAKVLDHFRTQQQNEQARNLKQETEKQQQQKALNEALQEKLGRIEGSDSVEQSK
jgi:hypothetical protein